MLIKYFVFQFDRAVRLFGEDNSTIQPDDFFAIFDSFLTALYEARQDNSAVKKRREEEEKRTRQEVEVCVVLIKTRSYIKCKINTKFFFYS